LVIVNGQRWLRFSPTDAAFGKNPGQLEPLEVPHFESPEFTSFLAGVIQTTKDRLNALSEDQKAAMAEQEWFRETLPGVTTAEHLNGLLGRASRAGQACKIMVRDRANLLGLEFDKTAMLYREAKQKAA